MFVANSNIEMQAKMKVRVWTFMFEKKTKFRLTFENWNWKIFNTRKTGHCFFLMLAHLKHVFVAEVGHLWTSKVRSLFFLIFFFNHANFDFIFLSKKYSRCDNWYLGTVGVKYYYSRTMRLYTHTKNCTSGMVGRRLL